MGCSVCNSSGKSQNNEECYDDFFDSIPLKVLNPSAGKNNNLVEESDKSVTNIEIMCKVLYSFKGKLEFNQCNQIH